MVTNYVVIIILALMLFGVVGWLTGSNEYSGSSKEDKRTRLIKQKAIINSWIVVLSFLVVNFTFDFFNLHKVKPEIEYPELFYLIILVTSYFLYYVIYSRRFSTNKKG